MRTFLLLFLSIFWVNPIHASSPENILIKINFNYQHYENIHHEQFSVKNQIISNRHDHQWISIAGSNRFTLLAKIENASSESITIKFKFINDERYTHIIYQPELVMKYNQEKKLTINDKNKQIDLCVFAMTV